MPAPRSIRARILAVFSLSLLFFGGALGYGILQLRSIGAALVVVDVGYLPLTGVAADLQAMVRQMDRDHDRVSQNTPRPLEGHRANARFYQASLEEGITRGRSYLTEARAEVPDPGELDALDDVDAQIDRIEASMEAHDAAYDAWLAAEGATGAQVEMDRRRKELGNDIRQLAALVEGRVQRVSEQTVRAQNRALLVSGALAAVAVVMAGLLAWVALVTLRPIGRLTEQVQRIARGDYAGRVDVDGDDEVALLGREFNSMAEAVSERDRVLQQRADALDRLSLRLRQVLDTIRAGLVVAENDRVATLNPAAAELWGVAVGAALPESLSGLEVGRYEAVAHGERLFDIDVAPFGDGVLIVGEDVTERLHDRERLARSERLALVGQMLAQITHEVRNPLNAISLNAELLAEEIEADEPAAMLGTITSEIRRLEGVTARYLDLSRRRRPELAAEDPMAIVSEVTSLEAEVLRRAEVDIALHGEALGLGELDGEALRRVLRNLVRNAVEAGAGHIEVGVQRIDGSVEVAVSDDGPGMTPAEVGRVFEPFYTTKAKGTGLGLAISRQELEDVGGTLHCSSEPDRGSTFTITIPVVWSDVDNS